MVIEWLKFRVSAELREKFIQKDAQIWTAMLAKYPGFLGKEVWINPETPSEVILVIHWASKDAWAGVPADQLEKTEQQFNQEFGDQHQIIQTGEYQVRKFPQVSS
ncbi:MAG TPA: TIGR03792 family protein [Coleofasciculaceae cyanobacterium]|jgi:uncharacterized protein (TIGR03792 family)